MQRVNIYFNVKDASKTQLTKKKQVKRKNNLPLLLLKQIGA